MKRRGLLGWALAAVGAGPKVAAEVASTAVRGVPFPAAAGVYQSGLGGWTPVTGLGARVRRVRPLVDELSQRDLLEFEHRVVGHVLRQPSHSIVPSGPRGSAMVWNGSPLRQSLPPRVPGYDGVQPELTNEQRKDGEETPMGTELMNEVGAVATLGGPGSTGRLPSGNPRFALRDVLRERKLELELELPAGTIVTLNGKRHVLVSASTVRTSDPTMVVEGTTISGSEADTAWPEVKNLSDPYPEAPASSPPDDGSMVRMRVVEAAVGRANVRVALLAVDAESVRAHAHPLASPAVR